MATFSWIRVIVGVWSTSLVVVSGTYYGVSLGSFTTHAHQVKGDVYAVDQSRIRLVHFTYDGTGPDAFFYIGERGKTASESRPASDGTKILDENGRNDTLGRYSDADIVLTINGSVTQVLWISVWCRDFAANFGDLVFPSTFDVPAPVDIGTFSSLAHGLVSGSVIVQDTKTLFIQDLHYDGLGPDAFFWVGSGGAPHENGTKVPDELGSEEKLKAYTGVNITILLPGELSINDVDWISVFCVNYTQDFGHIILPTVLRVPPYIEEPENGPLANCLHLDDHLNVKWEVMGDEIAIEMIGALERDGGYMAFGLSGSDTRTSMIGADVFVAYYDDNEDEFKVEDYKLTAYSMCSGSSEGACPDTVRGGNNNLQLLTGLLNGGISTVRFKRLLTTPDTVNDIGISPAASMFVVWGTGKLTSEPPYQVTKHDRRQIGNRQVIFGQASSSACDNVVPREETNVVAWPPQMINGQDTNLFYVKIGPTGGPKGYTAITGFQSWGIAYYINGKLIPELYLKRGDTYTFIVEAGDNPEMSASYHPFYITDDSVGGYSKKLDAEKLTVMNYAGVDSTGDPVDGAVGRFCEYEAATNPQPSDTFEDYFSTLTLRCVNGTTGNLTWIPDASTPDLLYYQCWAHNYLGWKIHVIDDYDDVPRPVTTDSMSTDSTTTASSAAPAFSASILNICAMLAGMIAVPGW